MTITDNEFNSLIGRLREQALELDEFYDDRNTILGNIGEKFVGYCICRSLWRLGYPINFHNAPHSYLLKPKVGADDEGLGGIDYYLKIVNLNENIYRFLIEAKNWGHYSITPNMFNRQILNRFTTINDNRDYHRIVTMNIRNIDNINARCEENNINILPISHHITPENLHNTNIMRTVFNDFIDSFTNLITTLAPEDSYPDIQVDGFGANRTHNIIQDLLLGVPYSIIEHRYSRSRKYISKIASYVRGFVPLPDRRRKDWRLQWEIQE